MVMSLFDKKEKKMSRKKKDEEDKKPAYAFADILRGLQNAVSGAQDMLQEYQLHNLSAFWGTDGKPVSQKVELGDKTVDVPLLTLVPHSQLAMEVTDTNTTTSKDDKSASAEIGGTKFGITAKISGKVSSSRENTRSTNQTAKYQVHVSASQQPQTEGLSRLMDIMASCIEPLPKTRLEPRRVSIDYQLIL